MAAATGSGCAGRCRASEMLKSIGSSIGNTRTRLTDKTEGVLQARTYMTRNIIDQLKTTADKGNFLTSRVSFLLRTVELVAVSVFEEVSSIADLAAGTIYSLSKWNFAEIGDRLKEVSRNALLIPAFAVAAVVVGLVGTLFPRAHYLYKAEREEQVADVAAPSVASSVAAADVAAPSVASSVAVEEADKDEAPVEVHDAVEAGDLILSDDDLEADLVHEDELPARTSLVVAATEPQDVEGPARRTRSQTKRP